MDKKEKVFCFFKFKVFNFLRSVIVELLRVLPTYRCRDSPILEAQPSDFVADEVLLEWNRIVRRCNKCREQR